MPHDNDHLLHRLIGGDTEAAPQILDAAATSMSPRLLVAAALVCADPEPWLSRAAVQAATTRDRQLVAVAIAHFGADEDLLDALVRDHLADHPDGILAAWIAAQHSHSRPAVQSSPARPPVQSSPARPPVQSSPARPPVQSSPARPPAPASSWSRHV